MEGKSQISDKEEDCNIISIEQFKKLENYSDIVNKLKEENRIDVTDAAHIKMVSSHSFVAFKQTPDSIINQHGKINEGDVSLIYQISINNSDYIIIISAYLGFCHSFRYDISLNRLERIANKGSIILSGAEAIRHKKIDNLVIVLFAENKYYEIGNWIKYYSLDLNSNTFTHTKNCRIVDNEEECKEIKQIDLNKYIRYESPAPNKGS